MPYSYQIKPVLDLVRALIKANLTAQSEPPASLPLSTTLEQAVLLVTELPMTVIQVKTATAEDLGNSDLITLPLEIHHVRELESAGSGAETAMVRLAAVAAALKNDFRLHGVATEAGLTGADVPIHQARPERLTVGDDNVLQQTLTMNDQSVSLVACSLEIRIDWYEGAY